VELYAYLREGVDDARDELIDELAGVHGVERTLLVDHLYVHAGEDVARHLCRVAAGLDSLVLGEAEILGQVGASFAEAREAAAAGPVLTLLFRTAIAAGRRARVETAIGANPATASSMALALAEGALGDLSERRALVVGAGGIGQQTFKAASGRGVGEIAVANRTRDRAVEVARELGGAAYGLDELEDALAWADVAITATSSDAPIVSAETLRAAMARRPDAPLVLVDLAVPADVEREAADVPGVRLFDVDDLRAGLDDTVAARLAEVPKVEALIEDEVGAFGRRYRELDVEPLVAEIRCRAEAIREEELRRTLRHLGAVDPVIEAHVTRLSHALVNKLLHEPTAQLRERADQGDADELAAVVRDLFGLTAPTET
jgi:glutamyl-tRNA reductase